jgi:cytochrome c556
MKKLLLTALATAALSVTAVGTFAQDETPFANQINARQSFMQVYRFNLMMLGAMARGDMEYDAEQASAAADNLLAASKMRNGAMWPAGSDSSAPGLAGVTAAKADLWASDSMAGEKHQALTAALEAMAAAAGDGLGAVRANMGAVGDGCSGCHDNYRESDD